MYITGDVLIQSQFPQKETSHLFTTIFSKPNFVIKYNCFPKVIFPAVTQFPTQTQLYRVHYYFTLLLGQVSFPPLFLQTKSEMQMKTCEAFVKKVTYYKGTFPIKKISKLTHPFIYDKPFAENLRTCIFWGSLTCLNNSSISLSQLKLQFFQSLNNTIIRRELVNVYYVQQAYKHVYQNKKILLPKYLMS